MKKRILFLYNWVELEKKRGAYCECAGDATIADIEACLQKLGYDVVPVNLMSPEQLHEVLTKNMPLELAFVIAEGFLKFPQTLYDGTGAGLIREALQTCNIPYTHSDPDAMERCRIKNITSELLSLNDIPVPKFYTFDEKDYPSPATVKKIEQELNYPLFVKPCGGGNSIGIDENSLVQNERELLTKLTSLYEILGNQPFIVEEYLPGREYTVGVVGNDKFFTVFPPVVFPENNIRSTEKKRAEYYNRDKFSILKTTDPKFIQLKNIAEKTFKVLGVKDVIRIDIKEDISGKPRVIDVNGTPSLSKKGSLVFTAEMIGLSQLELIALILCETMKRQKLEPSEEHEAVIKTVNRKLTNNSGQVA